MLYHRAQVSFLFSFFIFNENLEKRHDDSATFQTESKINSFGIFHVYGILYLYFTLFQFKICRTISYTSQGLYRLINPYWKGMFDIMKSVLKLAIFWRKHTKVFVINETLRQDLRLCSHFTLFITSEWTQ